MSMQLQVPLYVAGAAPPKPPGLPNKPINAYLRFSKTQWSEVSGSGTEKGRQISARWKAPSLEERQPFQDAYEEEKAEYDRLSSEYYGSDAYKAWDAHRQKNNDMHEQYQRKSKEAIAAAREAETAQLRAEHMLESIDIPDEIREAMRKADSAQMAAARIIEQGGQQGDAAIFIPALLSMARHERNERLMRLIFSSGGNAAAAVEGKPVPGVVAGAAAGAAADTEPEAEAMVVDAEEEEAAEEGGGDAIEAAIRALEDAQRRVEEATRAEEAAHARTMAAVQADSERFLETMAAARTQGAADLAAMQTEIEREVAAEQGNEAAAAAAAVQGEKEAGPGAEEGIESAGESEDQELTYGDTLMGTYPMVQRRPDRDLGPSSDATMLLSL